MKGTDPAERDENVGDDENVLPPAKVCVPVVTAPLADAPASGILKVCVEPDDPMLKSVPDVPVANDCVAAVNPFTVPILLLKVFQSVLESKPAVTPDVPDMGRLNVWVEPDDDQLGAVPLVPGVENVCVVAVRPLSDVMVALEAAISTQPVLV